MKRRPAVIARFVKDDLRLEFRRQCRPRHIDAARTSEPAVFPKHHLPESSTDPHLFNSSVAVQFDSRAENDPMTDKSAGEFAGWVVAKITKSTYEITSRLPEKAS